MCILSFIPAGVLVDDSIIDDLRNGGISNPDGHGWAVVAGDRIVTGHSLSLRESLESFRNARNEYRDGPAMFHSRWATHGSVNPDNCHPFRVGGSELTVVGHNGVLPSSAWPKKGDDRSDTKLFADEILCTRYRRLDKPRAFQALTNWIGTGNKLVILTVDPRYRENAYLVNETAGVWDTATGVWHSNTAFMDWYPSSCAPSSSRSYGGSYWKSPATLGGKSAAESAAVFDDDDRLQREFGAIYSDCDWCGTGWIGREGYCNQCTVCVDCGDCQEDCACPGEPDVFDYDDDGRQDDDTAAEHGGLLSAAVARLYGNTHDTGRAAVLDDWESRDRVQRAIAAARDEVAGIYLAD